MKIRFMLELDLSPAEVEALVHQARIAGFEDGPKRRRIAELADAELCDLFAEYTSARRCRSCGCTDRHGCPEGCEWVEANLCSLCVEDEP